MVVAVDMPDDPAIDRSRKGVLRLTPELIVEMLGLPRTVAFSGARIDYGYGNQAAIIELLLAGDPLPNCAEGAKVEQVIMLCRVEVTDDGMRTVYGCFAHRPDQEWIITRRPSSSPSHSQLA